MFLTISLAIVDTGSSYFDARACEQSGAGAVIFPSERRAPSEDSAPLAQPKMPFGNFLVRESVE